MCFLLFPLHCHGVFVPALFIFPVIKKSLTLLWRKEAITSAEVSLSAKFNLLIPKNLMTNTQKTFMMSCGDEVIALIKNKAMCVSKM